GQRAGGDNRAPQARDGQRRATGAHPQGSAPRNAAGPRADAKRNDAGRPQGRAPGEAGAARAPAPARNRPAGNGTRGVLLGK
ncbi:hypothetical protein L494_5022, partial [Bordetella bronchiseptica CA90 BB1334]